MEQTLFMVKPDAVRAGNAGAIIQRVEEEGFKIVAMKKVHLTVPQAEKFYEVHSQRPFYGELVEFMTSGPVVPMILAKDNAIADMRTLVGNTDSEQAEKGTIRNRFGTDKAMNAVHASDAPETAAHETSFFFSQLERVEV